MAGAYLRALLRHSSRHVLQSALAVQHVCVRFVRDSRLYALWRASDVVML